MISRRKILECGATAAVIAGLPFINIRRAFAQSALPFDYFISPNGDDNNVGSLASPWSITALNSKMGAYAGKRIGIIGDIGGTQTPITYGTIGGTRTTLLSIVNANGNQPALNTNGGTSAASTYIASCNSSGVYTPRWAIIDFGSPTNQTGFCFGQSSESASQVPNPGYCTFDGLTIRNFSFCAICFENPNGTILQGCVIQNCEIYGGSGVPSNNNPGAIRFWNAYGAVVHNNKIHDLACNGGGASPLWGYNAIMCYGTAGSSIGMVITNNTTYNCSSILTKDFNSDFANCSYNYLDHGNFGSAAQIDTDIGTGVVVGHTPYTGVTSVFHHNICLGEFQAFPQSVGNPYVTGACQIYNNTFYGTSNYASFDALYCKGGKGAAIQFYRNIVYAIGGYDQGANASCIFVDPTFAATNATFNNNVYGSNGNACKFARSEYAGLTLASWRSSTALDQNSVVLSSSPFTSTPTTQVASSFAVGSSAVIGGVTCGALDGSGSVGCNFGTALVPAAPALKVT